MAAIGVSSVPAVSGCLGIGDFGSEEPPEPEPDEDENEEDEDEEDEEEIEVEIDELAHESTAEVLENIQWLKNNYRETVNEYVTAGNEVHDVVETIQETLEQGENVSEGEIEELFRVADNELARIGPRLFGDHFDGHRNIARRFEEREESALDYARLNERERLLELIDELDDELSQEFDPRFVRRRYPIDPLTRKGYTWFINNPEETHRLFEVFAKETTRLDRDNELKMHVIPHIGTHASHDGYSFEPEIRDDESLAFNDAIGNDVLEYVEPYSDEESRLTEFFIRTSYLSQDAGFSGGISVDLEENTKSTMYIQEYEDSQAAMDAYDRVLDSAEEYDTTEHFGLAFEQVFAEYNDSNVYADIIQLEELLVFIDVTREPWRSRESVSVDESVSDDGEVDRMFLYEGTFFDQTEQYREITEPEDDENDDS